MASGVVNTAGFGGTAILAPMWANCWRVAPGPNYSLTAFRFAFSVFIALSLLAFLAANLIKEQPQSRWQVELTMSERTPILVSACLAGLPCRYDGRASPTRR